ncbi:hypothetical protein ABZW18_25015 [Streptomyces sp. NPDC004647]|uniref:hypothetical protein n=1 Tax=Streptomyces sp. NPDC004647 TaxID=3154671 RepID=UPI0033A8A995
MRAGRTVARPKPYWSRRAVGSADVRLNSSVYVAGWTGRSVTSFWLETWARVCDAMLATGLVDAAQVDAAVQALASSAFAALSPGMITAWGGCRA